MLLHRLLAAMPPQESLEDIIKRLEGRMEDRARDNFGFMDIDSTDFTGFHRYKDALAKHFRNGGLQVNVYESRITVSWHH